jgi:subtilisin-like proprotein convertase family protein/uncharacterized protein YvpB
MISVRNLIRIAFGLIGGLFLWILIGNTYVNSPASGIETERQTGGLFPIHSSQFLADAETITSTLTLTASLTPTQMQVTLSPVVTATQTSTATLTETPTWTPTITATPQPTPTITPTWSPNFYLPWVNRAMPPTPTPTPTLTPTPIPGPPVTAYFCSANVIDIPDDSAAGINDSIYISDPRQVLDLNIRLDIAHTYVSDLIVRLRHEETGKTIELINRPLLPKSPPGCSYNNVGTILDDEITLPVENQCASSPAAIAGIFTPNEPLSNFDGENITGAWTLDVSDHGPDDLGALRGWCMAATIGYTQPTPEPPPPPQLPAQARIYNISGKPQALPLDCESRVAVDWAAYFGTHINELTFFQNLPRTDNPDTGFVGDVYGAWGQIPPRPYGVHAEPVANLLRAYGVQAYAHRPLSWDDLRAEIAANRPVYVWTIGAADSNEIPIYYAGSDGITTVVAHYEHTVMVVGYDSSNVILMDGGAIKTRSIFQFLSSWSALGNMAITANP